MSMCSLNYNNKQGIDQFCKWPHSNNEHRKSVVFKFVSVRQAFLFNADRITYNVECAWYQLSTRIQWKLHWYTVGRETSIEEYQYCTSLQIAFESLLSQKFTRFILTVRCIGVSIYCNGDIGFKIFDSHARDVYGTAHLQGTCVLLETLSVDSLVCYLLWQGWPSGESTCLPAMWPGFDFRTWCHMWIDFVGSLLCHERFFPEYSDFPFSSKTKISHLIWSHLWIISAK